MVAPRRASKQASLEPQTTPSNPARRDALSLLARRMLSERELVDKLQARGHSQEAAEDALEMARGYRYVDDSELVRMLQGEAERTLRGPNWLTATLKRRGVEEHLAEAARQTLAENEAELARDALRKRFRDDPLAGFAERRRAAAYLMRRGFSPGCAAETLRRAESTEPRWNRNDD